MQSLTLFVISVDIGAAEIDKNRIIIASIDGKDLYVFL